MMRSIAVLTSAAVVVVALVIVGGGLLDRSPGVGGPPVSTAPSPLPPGPSPSASGATADPDAATATGQIAYHASVDGNRDIYVANGDGTGVIRLTTDPGADMYPSWSPDGGSIAFLRDGDVYVMAADGTGARRITSSPEAEIVPSFSPDGSKLVFGRPTGAENAAIYQVDLDGSHERLLYEEPETHLEGGARLIAEDVLLAVRDEIGGGGLEIVRVDLTTGVETPLTDYRDGEESFFAVSPDGARLAYQSDGPEPGLLVMEADGTNSRHVTSEYSGGWIAWTADGSTLSHVSGGWINLIRPDGTGSTRLLQGDSPAWRPAT
ncbi:MAG TPA: DPP IV N-terminal domain-containing protein [Actinomycetota bacterium]|nr:DPP IV N-terminal domain-containing protein [Actinomycetota bacterium]